LISRGDVQHCNWVELLQCVGLEMVAHVVEWEWIFEMDLVMILVVVEMNGRDDIEENIEDIR